MTGPPWGTAQGGQSALHLGVSQLDPKGWGLSTCWPGTPASVEIEPPAPCRGAPSAAPPLAQPGRVLCAGSDRHTWCSHEPAGCRDLGAHPDWFWSLVPEV